MKPRSKDSFVANRMIQLINGRNEKEIKTLLEDFAIYAMLSYIQGKKVVIPYVGEMTFHSEDAGLRYEFVLSQFLVRNIGQIENGEEPEIVNLLARKFKPLMMPDENSRKCTKPKKSKFKTVPNVKDCLSRFTTGE